MMVLSDNIFDKHFALEPSCAHAGVTPLFSNVKQYFVFRDSDQKIIYFARFVTDVSLGVGGEPRASSSSIRHDQIKQPFPTGKHV